MTDFKLHSTTASGAHPGAPILMVPGAFSSGRIWHDTFVPFFAERGHDVHTLTFAGHGRPRLPRLRCGRQRYLNDLRRAADRIGGEPLVLAHSMGGLTTLRLLAERDLPAAALLSPVPHTGLRSTLHQVLRTDPGSFAKFAALGLEPGVRHLGAPPRGIYSDTVDPALAKRVTADLAPESPRMLPFLLSGYPVALERVRTPVKFFAATGDHVVPPDAVAETAVALDAPMQTYDGMSHTFQAERAWRTVAEDVAAWFDESEAARRGAKAA
ncbi:MAG: alpha/beta fold hydrolase [Pseudomonadota bacterium]